MSGSSLNSGRIAKNTIYIYIRTIIVLLVSLYTSRIVLRVLGAEDLGVYNVVGGIVTLMSFFQAAQSRATSRFIAYELGKDSPKERLKHVFSVCMTIHVLIAVATIIAGETIGLYIIERWTDIPIERHTAAMWVYQFALLVFCVHVVRVPYDSIAIAYENMSMFAYMSVLEAALQLALVYCVMLTSLDSLVMYSALMVLAAFVIFLSYYFFVRYKYPMYKYLYTWDKDLSKRVLSFSGWTLLGTGANTVTQQGVNLLMNNFVGLVANAAMGFAGQVNIAVGKFVNGFSTAFTPQIIKLYAQKDNDDLVRLINRASKFSFALCYIIALPLICNMNFILYIWLGENIPQYTCEFCQLILLCTIIDATTGVYNTTITATGKIRAYQVMISLSFLLDLFTCFILLRLGMHPALVFGSRIITRGFLNMVIGLYFLKKQLGFNILLYSKDVLLKVGLSILVTVVPITFIAGNFDGFDRLLLTGFVSVVLTGLCTMYIIMTKSERETIVNKLMKR